MIVYAESSAVLGWLLGEPEEAAIRRTLDQADQVVTSALTSTECGRALIRGAVTGRLSQTDELVALHLLDQAVGGWTTLDVSEPVLDRARGRFPLEPVRTLDAIHLATAEMFHDALGGLTLLSLDGRVRENARGLGMLVHP